MEDTLNANKRRESKALITLCALAILLAARPCPTVFAQCALSPTEWLDKLSTTESAEIEVRDKIRKLSFLKQNYEECNQAPDSVLARIIHRLGDLHRVDGDFETGIRLTAEAVAINKAGNAGAQRSYLTHSYYNLGLYHSLMGMTLQSHLYYDSCIEVGLSYAEKVFIALMAFEKKAFLYFQNGDYEQSIAVAQRGSGLSKIHGLAEYHALLLIQRAQSETELDRIVDAEQNISAAVKLLEKLQLDMYLPNAYSVYAGILIRKREFDEAIRLYNASSKLNIRQGNMLQASRDLSDLGLLYDRELGDHRRAFAEYNRAVKILQTLHDPYTLAATYSNIGRMHWSKGDFNDALTYYQKGLMSLPLGLENVDASINPSRTEFLSASNPYVVAALLWNKGDSWMGLYKETKELVYLKHAINTYKDGDRMVDQMRWAQEGDQSKLFWRQKTKRWYASAVEAAFLLNNPHDAFYFMEKSRAVLLNDRLSELGAQKILPVQVAQKERQLRMRLNTFAAQSTTGSEGVLSSDSLWKARDELTNFIKRLEQDYPSYYSYKYDTVVSALGDLQRDLAADQAWIEIFSDDSTIFTLAVTKQDAVLKRINFPEHAAIAKDILSLCATKGSINRYHKRYQEMSHLYYKNVFEPLAIQLPRVAISQDEYFLPFDLLLKDPRDGTSFLLNDHCFSYPYSASYILKRGRNAQRASRTLLAIAPANYHSGLNIQDLTGADVSLKTLSANFADREVRLASAATKGRFMEEVGDFNVVHLYSHAYGDSVGNEPSVYFYDSPLRVSDLQTLPEMKTRLIVLLACNTGVGKMVRGEGIFSLARGFAAAGIPSTVSALWEIDNKATYALAESFYKHLATGMASDVALTQAKRDLIRSDQTLYELPYFWGGVVLIGKPESYASEPSHAGPTIRFYLIAASVAFLIACMLLWSERSRGDRLAGE